MKIDEVLEKVVAGVVITFICWLGKKVWASIQNWRKRRDGAGVPVENLEDFQPPRSEFMVGVTIVASLLGISILPCLIYEIVTTVPQYPWGHPLPGWAAVGTFGLPFCYLATKLMVWQAFQLRDRSKPYKPVSRKRYNTGVLLATLVTYLFMLYVVVDPGDKLSGLLKLIDQAAMERARELQPTK